MSFVTKDMYFTIAMFPHKKCEIYGDLHSPVLKKSVQFHDLTELVLIMDKIMQDFNVPKYDKKNRSFVSDYKSVNIPLEYQDLNLDNFQRYLDESLKFPMESQKNFTVKVMYRQHCTWQGQIVWVEEDKVRFFRSALELIALIYSTYNEDYQ